ncbi:MAG: AAA family ATPase [Bacteroidales bacterium]|nr:AAA family ATPase [Bacteroidales bacterium]MBR6175468.1 AAA family ATPase [Bacteroidales bacterium]MBR6904471.1 AAA family ATPase [Bacteroidales bacterium]
MLIKFAVKNFRGFAERIEWDLSHPCNYEFSPYAIKNGIIKNGIIYGPNGSGKSNFALAIFDIENHLSIKWKKQDYYSNFVNTGNPNSPVEFEYVFKFDNDLLEYKYSKNSAGLLVSESLMVNRKQVFKKDNAVFEIDDKQFKIDATVKENFKQNVNSVSVINFLTASYPFSQDHYVIKLMQFVNSMLWFKNLDSREFIGLETASFGLEDFIIQNKYVDDFARFLAKVSEQTFKFATPKEGDKILYCKIGDNTIPFLLIASTGTQALEVLYVWIKRMTAASFVFIDEFDAFYHFKLSFEVCKLLFNMDCQVFTSSHNTYLMTNELLRPDCNFILQNNKIKPLHACTEKELRFGHNIEKIYRADAFHVE